MKNQNFAYEFEFEIFICDFGGNLSFFRGFAWKAC